jgi:hypothetical protein
MCSKNALSGGKNPPTRAVKLHANFMKILRALNAEVVVWLSIACRYIVAWWVGAAGSAGWRFGFQQSLSIAYAIVRRGLLVGVADTVTGGGRWPAPPRRPQDGGGCHEIRIVQVRES